MSAVIDCHSRVAPHRNAPEASPRPASPADRERALADAVFAAVIALQAQLAHPDAAVVREAAGLILDFEKTRLRHGRPVTGLGEVFAATCGSGTPNPVPSSHSEEVENSDDGSDPDDETEPDEDTVQRVREHLQQLADERSTGEQVSWDRAYRAAKRSLARARLRQTASPPV